MPANSRTPLTPPSLALLLVGIALTVVGMSLDGWLRGLCQGAGVATILIAVAMLSARMRRPGRSGRSDSMWLPSRDEADQ